MLQVRVTYFRECLLSARLLLSCLENHMLQVRVAYFREGEPQPETSKLAQHSGRAHKLALIPEQPTCFYRQVAGLTS